MTPLIKITEALKKNEFMRIEFVSADYTDYTDEAPLLTLIIKSVIIKSVEICACPACPVEYTPCEILPR